MNNSNNIQLPDIMYYWTSKMDGKGNFNTEHYAKVLKAKAELLIVSQLNNGKSEH